MSGKLGSQRVDNNPVRQAIRSRFGVTAIEERMHRLCLHCIHWDHSEVVTDKSLTICERNLCPVTLDGDDCPYFTESKPEVSFVLED